MVGCWITGKSTKSKRSFVIRSGWICSFFLFLFSNLNLLRVWRLQRYGCWGSFNPKRRYCSCNMDRQPWAIMSVKTVTEGKDWRSYYSWAYVLFVLVFPLVCVCGEATDSVRTRDTHTHTWFACLSSQYHYKASWCCRVVHRPFLYPSFLSTQQVSQHN